MGTHSSSRKEAYEGVMQENRVVGFLESRHMTQQNRSLHIAMEEKNFIWSRQQVKEFIKMYKKGFSLKYIAEYFDRKPVEVLLLSLDRVEAGVIKMREGWRIW